MTFNPEGRLTGAVAIRVAGNYAYVLTESSGLQVVDVSSPRSPKWVAGGRKPADRGRAFGGNTVPLRIRHGSRRSEGGGHHGSDPAESDRRDDSTGGRARHLSGANLWLRRRGARGSGHPRHRESRAAERGREVRRRWAAQRRDRRDDRVGQCQHLRLRRRRQERAPHRASHRAGRDDRAISASPKADTGPDRDVPDGARRRSRSPRAPSAIARSTRAGIRSASPAGSGRDRWVPSRSIACCTPRDRSSR